MQNLLSVLCLCISTRLYLCLAHRNRRCRDLPGESGFLSKAEWDKFITNINGRLAAVVPNCRQLLIAVADMVERDQRHSESKLYSEDKRILGCSPRNTHT